MYPKADEGAPLRAQAADEPPPPARGFPMSGGGGGGGYYQAGGATAALAVQAKAPVAAWSTGLCDCFDDCSNCCVTCLCPCITFGQVAEIIDRGSTSCGTSGALYTLIMLLTGCHCVFSCFYRAKMRAQYGLQESPCADCCVHWCCEYCALCQEYRELKKRGFDMKLGSPNKSPRPPGVPLPRLRCSSRSIAPPPAGSSRFSPADAMYAPNAEGGAAPAATGYPMSGGAMLAPTPVAPWSTGLFDCFDDVESCCVTWLCPCITFGQVAEIVDRGSTSCGASAALYTLIIALTGSGFACIYSCFYRSKLRAQYGLQETPCPDCCVHFCCELCALCQEYRELKNRGFGMSIGWHANMERQGRAAATMPPQIHAGMTR